MTMIVFVLEVARKNTGNLRKESTTIFCQKKTKKGGEKKPLKHRLTFVITCLLLQNEMHCAPKP